MSLHRQVLRGWALPPARNAGPGTFVHGFLLPFTLIFKTLRHPTLGLSHVRVTVVRIIAVALLSFVAFSWATKPKMAEDGNDGVVIAPQSVGLAVGHRKKGAARTTGAVRVDASGIHVHVDDPERKTNVNEAGQHIATVDDREDEGSSVGEGGRRTPPGLFARLERAAAYDWAWLLWAIGILSTIEGIIVALSRRWDDWHSFHLASVVRIVPDEREPKTPKISVDLRWLIKKLKRRVRGYVVFTAGIPLFLLFRLVPSIGSILFSLALTAWGWYWLGVFSAAKSGHAWADDGVAPSPVLIRELRDRPVGIAILEPVRWYARIWARITRSLDAAVHTFERNPAPYLGLALARAILAFPILYLLARPVVPVAAGRLVAENDPADRFSDERFSPLRPY